MQAISLNNLTEQQRKILMQEAVEFAKQQELLLQNERQSYKKLISDKVEKLFPSLQNLSSQLSNFKRHIYEEFKCALEIKKNLYNTDDVQNTHTFSNKKGDKRITIGYYTVDNYDDTANEGIEKVKQYISSLAKDDNSKRLVHAVLKLLAKDQKGNLKAGRVLQLRKMANESGDKFFIDGVRIIEDAYKPIRTKTFVRTEFKNEEGAWVSVPLGMTEA